MKRKGESKKGSKEELTDSGRRRRRTSLSHFCKCRVKRDEKEEKNPSHSEHEELAFEERMKQKQGAYDKKYSPG